MFSVLCFIYLIDNLDKIKICCSVLLTADFIFLDENMYRESLPLLHLAGNMGEGGESCE